MAGDSETPVPFEARRYLEDYFQEVDAEYEALYRYWCGALARDGRGAGGLRAADRGLLRHLIAGLRRLQHEQIAFR